MKFLHINIVAKDHKKLSDFYRNVFGSNVPSKTLDLEGAWVDKLTGIKNARIKGEVLTLNLDNSNPLNLEIFSWQNFCENPNKSPNKSGLAHLAFEVSDINKTLEKIIENNGEKLGEIVEAELEEGKKARLLYALDCEGNILELINWI